MPWLLPSGIYSCKVSISSEYKTVEELTTHLKPAAKGNTYINLALIIEHVVRSGLVHLFPPDLTRDSSSVAYFWAKKGRTQCSHEGTWWEG